MDFPSVAHDDILLNFYKRADKAVIADLAFLKIDRLDHGTIDSKFNISYLNTRNFGRINHDSISTTFFA